VLSGEIYFEQIGNMTGVYVSKPLLMPLLCLLMWVNRKSGIKSETRLVTFGLVFSMFGDIFLMFRREDLFVFGLGSFLVAHLLYVFGFRTVQRFGKAFTLKERLFYALPFLLFVSVFLYVLHKPILDNPLTKELLAPVIVYASVISMMGYFALQRCRGVKKHGFTAVFTGAMLFIISDSVIAINKFLYEGNFPEAQSIIMITYGAAQYLIAYGVLSND
jgi:uncharacterized membrane protein YhhN